MNLEVLMDMCRACMKAGGVLFSMYENNEICSKYLPDKLIELTSVQLNKCDGLPTKLCAKCAYRIESFYEFKVQVQKSDRMLRKMFHKEEPAELPITSNCETLEKLENIQKELSSTPGEYLEEENDSPVTDYKTDVNEISLPSNYDASEFLAAELCDEPNELPTTEYNEEAVDLPIVKYDENISQNNSIDNEEYLVGGKFQESLIPRGYSELTPSRIENLSLLQSANLINKTFAIDNASAVFIPSDGLSFESIEEIKHILEAQNLQCTMGYVDDDESNTIKSHENFISNENNDDKPQIYVAINTKETEDHENTTDENQHWHFLFNNKSKESLENSEKNKIAENEDVEENVGNLDCQEKDENRNDKEKNVTSDSETDTSDSNVLGSLNDTITNVKEIKENGKIIQYQCILCCQNYEKLSDALTHIVDHHVPHRGPFYCVICEMDCPSRRKLRLHVKTHTGELPYKCFLCVKAYGTKKYLKRHMVCHPEFCRHRCSKCGLRFKVKSELESHVKAHIDGKQYVCNQCPRVYNHKGNFKRHLISHIDPKGCRLPKFPCTICGKRFLNNRTLTTHMRVHTGEKPYKCEECGKLFSQQGNLLNHIKIHSNPRSYMCDICGKKFNQSATLRDHRFLHTGEKPHICRVCGTAFTFGAALRRHMWSHADKKPYKCNICSATFVGRYDLTRHMKIHSDRPRKVRRFTIRRDNTSQAQKETIQVNNEIQDTLEQPQGIIFQEVYFCEETSQIITKGEAEKENSFFRFM